MQLTKLTIDNFMSVGHAEESLHNRGLVLIQGDNQSNDSMESNGSGKSTIFSEAVVWVLFGETIRGLKGDEIVKRDVGKNTRVSQIIIEDDVVYEVIRYRKHKDHKNQVFLLRNDIDISGKSDAETTSMIESILDMDFITFTNSVLFGQGLVKTFASTTDSEQKKILERMLQIDIFKKCADLSKEHMTKLNLERVTLTSKLESLDQEYKQLNQTVLDLQKKEAELSTQVAEHIEVLKAQKGEYVREKEKYKDETILSEIALVKDLMSKVEILMSKYDAYQTKVNETEGHISMVSSGIKKDQGLLEQLALERKDLLSGKSIPTTCKTCGQALPKGDTTSLEAKLNKDIKEIIEELAKSNDLLDGLEGTKEFLAEKLKEKEPLTTQYLELRDELSAEQSKLKSNAAHRADLDRLITSTDKQILQQERLLEETYTDLIQDCITKIGMVEHDHAMFEQELLDTTAQYDKYKFWQDAFGNSGIKSLLLDSVTPFLNDRANEYLGKLSDSTISVQFNTQTKLKTGEYREKFSIDVTNANGDDEYKGNSGGEKRRVDVAISLALQDLVSSRSNKKINLCLYDEAFDGLDAIGCEKVVSLLKEKQSEKDTIFVITHNDSLRSHFDNIITVQKSEKATIILEG